MSRKPINRQAIAAVKKYIENNFTEELGIEILSTRVNMSKEKLQSLFKEAYTMPIYTYIVELRMNRAALLLQSTDLSIKEVAASVGYKKSSKFSPMFKSYFSKTPTEYRILHSR